METDQQEEGRKRNVCKLAGNIKDPFGVVAAFCGGGCRAIVKKNNFSEN